jgi:hypothetical protein
MLNLTLGNELIKNTIESDETLAAGKMGMSEYGGISNLMMNQILTSNAELLYVNAGVYPPTLENFIKFRDTYLKSLDNMNVLGEWIQTPDGAYGDRMFFDQFATKSKRVHARSLEPFYHKNPWSKALEGKKVLVVSPFEESIRMQYKKRELLWENKDILPEFELDTIKTPFSAALLDNPVFNTWHDGLEYFKEEIEKKKPDFVIVGAGAWSVPIVSFCKGIGIDAIHMGGGTQILFGIKGGRWDNHDEINKFFNEYWIRPNKKERPLNMNRMRIDNGDYW